MAGQRTSLFARDSEQIQGALIIYCSQCGQHAFTIDEETAAKAGILSLKCPKCSEGTSISVAPNGAVIVVPGYPENNLIQTKRSRKNKSVSAE